MSAINDPASGVVAITPSDSGVSAIPQDAQMGFRAFVPGTDGNVAVVDAQGRATTVAVKAGLIYDIRFIRINFTNTTSTGIVGLY